MELVKKSLSKWISAAIVLVIGILVIVAGAQFNNYSANAGDTVDAMSMVLGISFIVVGSLGILLALIGTIISKKGFAAAALTGGMSLALGIWFVVAKTAFELITLLVGTGNSLIPFILIVSGFIIAVDAVFLLINGLRDKNVKAALPAMIFGIIVAAAALVLGFLCVGDDPVIKSGTQLIIFGIILIIYACFAVLATFVELPTVVNVEVKEENK